MLNDVCFGSILLLDLGELWNFDGLGRDIIEVVEVGIGFNGVAESLEAVFEICFGLLEHLSGLLDLSL